MPDSNFRDVTDRVPASQRVWTNPLVVCELQNRLVGTFCFPLGPEFGCGSQLTITAGQSFSMSGKFSAGGAEVGASQTYTQTVAWQHKSNACDWCAPKVCYPNSTMDIWSCERFLDWYSWTTTDVNFSPGRAQMFPNCARDNAKCGCTAQQQAAALVSPDAGGYAAANDGRRTKLVRTIGFVKRPGEPVSDPEKDLVVASQFVDSLFDTPSEDCDHRADAVVIETYRGERVALAGPAAGEYPVVLLSGDCADAAYGAVRTQSGNMLPVLVASGPLPGARANVLVRARRKGAMKVVHKDKLPAHTGRLTTFWKEIDLAEGDLAKGERDTLEIEIVDGGGQTVARLCEPVRRPHLDDA